MESDYLATALSAASKGKTMKGQSPEQVNRTTHDKTGEDKPDEDDMPEVHEGHHAACKEMMDCMNSGDHVGLANALHSFMKMSK